MRGKITVAITLLLACAASLPAQVEHRDLKSGQKRIHLVVLAPMRIDLTGMSMKGAEPMMKEARETELPLTLEIEAALRDLGYPLDAESLSIEAQAKDADLRYAVDDLQKKFDAELQLMHRKSKGVRKGRFSLGDEIAKLPLSDKVDALLFVRARGQVLTENKKAFGTFVAGPRSDLAVMDFGLVDARTGDVLYFARSKVAANLVEDSEDVAAGIAKAFADLPKASPTALGTSSLSAGQEPAASAADARAIAAMESAKPAGPAAAVLPPAEAGDSGAQVRRLRLSHAVLKGMLIKKVMPEYPGIAQSSGAEGDVVMRVVIDRNGQVVEVADVSGAVQLISAATSAVKQWRYRPFTVKGQVFEVETQIVMTFKIGR
jgi:TonB family protein